MYGGYDHFTDVELKNTDAKNGYIPKQLVTSTLREIPIELLI